MKVYKILGKEGRITVPQELRLLMDISGGDIVSFEMTEDRLVLKKEKLCSCEEKTAVSKKELKSSMHKFAAGLTAAERNELMTELTLRWAEEQMEGKGAGC